jgi:hypothetical protein
MIMAVNHKLTKVVATRIQARSAKMISSVVVFLGSFREGSPNSCTIFSQNARMSPNCRNSIYESAKPWLPSSGSKEMVIIRLLAQRELRLKLASLYRQL